MDAGHEDGGTSGAKERLGPLTLGAVLCRRRSEHTDAFSGVASGRLVVGSTPMLPDLFADVPLPLAARERLRIERALLKLTSLKDNALNH